jgi:hypothetical protein
LQNLNFSNNVYADFHSTLYLRFPGASLSNNHTIEKGIQKKMNENLTKNGSGKQSLRIPKTIILYPDPVG